LINDFAAVIEWGRSDRLKAEVGDDGVGDDWPSVVSVDFSDVGRGVKKPSSIMRA